MGEGPKKDPAAGRHRVFWDTKANSRLTAGGGAWGTKRSNRLRRRTATRNGDGNDDDRHNRDNAESVGRGLADMMCLLSSTGSLEIGAVDGLGENGKRGLGDKGRRRIALTKGGHLASFHFYADSGQVADAHNASNTITVMMSFSYEV